MTRRAGAAIGAVPLVLLLAKGLVTCIGLLVGALHVTAIGAQDGTPPTFSSEASIITVDVVVLDPQGRPVRGLTQSDFEVYEDDRIQEVTRFETRDLAALDGESRVEAGSAGFVATNSDERRQQGRQLAFIIDDIALEQVRDPLRPGGGGSAPEAIAAVGAWLEERADPRDEVTLATTSGDLRWSDNVRDGRADLVSVLRHVTGKRPPASQFPVDEWRAYELSLGPGLQDATGAQGASRGAPDGMRAPGSSGSERVQALMVQDWTERHQRNLLRVVKRISDGMAARSGRKSIIILSESFLDTPNTPELRLAIEASRQSGTAVYFQDVRGPVGPAIGTDLLAINLTVRKVAGGEDLAQRTGGAFIQSGNDLLEGLARAVDESSAYYILGCQTPRPADGRWHTLEVRLPERPDLEIRARKGYYATSARRAAQQARAAAHDALMDAALVAGGSGGVIPLRLACRVVVARSGRALRGQLCGRLSQ